MGDGPAGPGRGGARGRDGRGGADQEVGGLSPPPSYPRSSASFALHRSPAVPCFPPPFALWPPRSLEPGLSRSSLPAFTWHPTLQRP